MMEKLAICCYFQKEYKNAGMDGVDFIKTKKKITSNSKYTHLKLQNGFGVAHSIRTNATKPHSSLNSS